MRQLFVAITLLVSATAARADDLSVRLRADADSEFEARVLVDRQTVGIWTQGISPKLLRTSLSQLTDAQADFGLLGDTEKKAVSGQDNEFIVYLRFDQPIKEASADWNAGFWTLDIKMESVQSLLAERLPHTKLALPGGVDTAALRHAELRLQAGEWAGAQLAYQALVEVYAVSAWATLRLGDVALITGDFDGACGQWQHVDTVSPGRVAGVLANLRARAVRCPKAVMPDWLGILMRRGRDDLVGQKLREETRWALQWETDPNALHQALSAGQSQLTTPLYDLIWARLIRQSEPYEVVKMASQANLPLWSHPEGVDLALSIGRAWCALEVPVRAATAVARLPRKNWIPLSPRGQRVMTSLISTCALAGNQAQTQKAESISAKKVENPTAQLRDALKQIDARIDNVQQVLQSETSLAEDSP